MSPRCLRDVDAARIAKDCRELLDAKRMFFEVTDRQLNMEFVTPALREPLRQFCDSFAAAPQAS